MAAVLPIIGLVASAGGTLLSASAAKQQAAEQAAAARTQALQEEKRARAEIAAGSREAAAKQREQEILLSNAQATAAASGGGATDPSILDLAGDIGGYGYMQRQTINANAENVASGYRDQATALRTQAKSALRAGKINAFSSILSGVTAAGKNFSDLMPKAR